MDEQPQNTLSERVRRHNHDGSETVKLDFDNLVNKPTIPAGSNTQVQFNDVGSLGASPYFTFNSSTKVLSIGDGSTDATLAASAGSNLDLQVGSSNFVQIKGNGTGQFKVDSGNSVNAIFNVGFVASSDKTYTFPNKTGVVALTTDLVPAWVDEGSLSWASSSATQTLTLTNAGKDLYMCLFAMPNLGATIDMQINSISASHYSYTFIENASVSNATSQTFWRLRDANGVPYVATYYIQGAASSNQITLTGTGSADGNVNNLIKGNLNGSSGNLSTITIIPGGSFSGKMHVYSLNL